MANDSNPSWKKNHPSSQLGNAVEKADRSVKQAMSHPEEIAVEHAFNAIFRAENAFANAVELNEHMDTVQQNKKQLNDLSQQLKGVQKEVNKKE
ncbi:hypothetical protein QWT69_13830 [Sporosarcina oncorhynchi]|uniref:Small, acid-soluble spore protein N n=1 Tax=Sporosarcina oncorhynchi TaxID=3056444 RepID=A0ABZ0L4S9_9BACL|nr:hypothetical protein [Sporosarcina sp. T2O-4]WOV86938.1 hypothetical protein QWT69_13830 [Sporosarcina sp. T2O-4]